MATEDGSVRITPREIYETLQGVKTNVDLLVLGFDEIRKNDADHESRIRVIEKRVWAIPSAAVLLAIASLVVAILSLRAHEPTPTNLGTGPSVTTPAAQKPATSPVSVAQPVPASTPATGTRSPEATVQPRSAPVTSKPAPVVPTLPTKPVIDLVSRLSKLVPKLPP